MLMSLLELAGNHTLQYSTAARTRLERLQGRTMLLKITPLEQTLSITPMPEGVEISTELKEADVTLTASIGALVKISRDGFEHAELEAGELKIEGDPIVGQRFAQIIGDLDIDWNALLRDQLGDAPALFVQLLAERVVSFSKQGRDQLRSAIATLLQQEFALVVAADEVDEVLDQIDDLRADTDKLEARLSKLIMASKP